VLAIESHAERAEALRELVGRGVREPLTVVPSLDAALATIDERVPEIILISPLMRPEDEAELVARLRALPKASVVQTLITPQFTDAGEGSRRRAAWRGRTDDDRARFIAELQTYVAMVRDQRVDLAALEEMSDRRAAVRVARACLTRLAVDGAAVDVVDLSATGAQVIASSLLVPGRTVQVVVEDRRRAMECRAAIVWGALEAGRASSDLHYRAGLDFRDGDRAFLERLCSAGASSSLDVADSFGRVLFATP
jgi:CheY-like chemotaxis protein